MTTAHGRCLSQRCGYCTGMYTAYLSLRQHTFFRRCLEIDGITLVVVPLMPTPVEVLLLPAWS